MILLRRLTLAGSISWPSLCCTCSTFLFCAGQLRCRHHSSDLFDQGFVLADYPKGYEVHEEYAKAAT